MEIINRFKFGVSIATKSDLIVRDIDILKEISRHSPVLVKITVTAADDMLCRKIEPNVAVSSERFKVINRLAQEGIFAGILMMPVLPFIEDTEDNISKIIELAYQNGAKFIYPAFGVTLRQNQRVWYYKKLEELFPSIKEKYIKSYGNKYECPSLKTKELWSLFQYKCDKLGILYKMNNIIRAYKDIYQDPQLSLF